MRHFPPSDENAFPDRILVLEDQFMISKNLTLAILFLAGLLVNGCGSKYTQGCGVEGAEIIEGCEVPSPTPAPYIPTPIPTPLPTVAPVYAPVGFFSSNGVGYFANEEKHYCQFASWEAWVAVKGPEDLSLVTNLAVIPSELSFDQICDVQIAPPAPPVGYFSVEGTGYFANEGGEYCAFASFEQWLKAGGPLDTTAAPLLAAVPATLTSKGICAYREFFSVAGIGYYANESGNYCRAINFSHWLALGGTQDPASIPHFDSFPESMHFDGDCAVTGFFFVQGTGYRTEADGKYCSLSSWEKYLALGGSEDVSKVATLDSVPASLIPSGECH